MFDHHLHWIISIPWSRNFAFGKTIYQPHLRLCSLTVVLRRDLNMEQPNALIWGALDYSHLFMSSWWTYSVMHQVTQSRLTSVWTKSLSMSKWTSSSDTETVTLSGQCEVHRFRVSWPCHCGRSSDAFQRWYRRAGPKATTPWMDPCSECELEVLHCSGTRTQNTGTPRTYEHRQLKSHGNSLNCHGKVIEKSWNCKYPMSVGTL